MLNSEKETTSPVPPIGQEQDFLADAKRRLTLEVPNKISRRKSVENLVISSHDAIGQSISHALSFSGAITQQTSQHSSSDHKNVSRSPSPCRRNLAAPISEHGDYLGQLSETGGNTNSKSATDASPIVQSSSQPPSFSLGSPLPEQTTPAPLNRSSSQECHPRNTTQINLTTANSAGSQNKSQEGRTKKKSWYSALYPTYKSRSEDFKKIFKDVPDEERLIVDYSCAIQKDILVHGRLYVSSNYLCFYANIFRWETFLSLRWKDVTAITKEKTALVIPNAILICTESEKHFLTSFAGRDKTYLMLFRIWQNALMEQPMSSQEMWQWVHICYGEELGFNSDDEDYPQNFLEEEKLSGMRLSAESIAEDKPRKSLCTLEDKRHMSHRNCMMQRRLSSRVKCDSCGLSSRAQIYMDYIEQNMDTTSSVANMVNEDNIPTSSAVNGNFNGADTLPTDMSDSSQSDADKPISFGHDLHAIQCTDPHEGRKLLSIDLHAHVDQLFTMLFTNSKFYVELLASRKTTDLVQAAWNHNPDTGLKTRKVSFTLLLNQTVGPKTSQVTETQVMQSCSKPGNLYSIEITSSNVGIPYADSFAVVVHYCLKKVSENVTNFQVFGQIKYKKSVWTVVKTFIEKNCWAGLEEYFDFLSKALVVELDDERGALKRKSRRRRRGIGVQRESGMEAELTVNNQHRPLVGVRHRSPVDGSLNGMPPGRNSPSPRLLWAVLAALIVLLIFNVALYYKLWGVETGMFNTEDKGSANVIGAQQQIMVSDKIKKDEFQNYKLLWTVLAALVVLLMFNVALYYKLWGVETGMFNTEDKGSANVIGSDSPSPEVIAEWSKLLQEQSSFHLGELDRWRKALNDAISLLRQTETALANLQSIIKPSLGKMQSPNSLPNSEL